MPNIQCIVHHIHVPPCMDMYVVYKYICTTWVPIWCTCRRGRDARGDARPSRRKRADINEFIEATRHDTNFPEFDRRSVRTGCRRWRQTNGTYVSGVKQRNFCVVFASFEVKCQNKAARWNEIIPTYLPTCMYEYVTTNCTLQLRLYVLIRHTVTRGETSRCVAWLTLYSWIFIII